MERETYTGTPEQPDPFERYERTTGASAATLPPEGMTLDEFRAWKDAEAER